jgi:pristinamycin I synthase-3/4
VLSLSFAQRRLWFLNKLEKDGAHYNAINVWRLFGVLDVGALRGAVEDVVLRHEPLRTVFGDVVGEPFRRVLGEDEVYVSFSVERVVGVGLGEVLDAAVAYSFDLESEVPVRVWVFEVGPDEHVFLLLVHHIAVDGWSLEPLVRELSEAYAARLAGGVPVWAPLAACYSDYVEWQLKLLGDLDDPGSLLARQARYWLAALEGMPEEVRLPVDRVRPAVASHVGGAVEVVFDAALHDAVVGLARQTRTTVFMVLHAALVLTLSRLGAGTDVPIGVPIAGRSDRALFGMIGFFVNTLVLRVRMAGCTTFQELLREVRTVDLGGYANQELPFDKLVEMVNPERVLSRQSLFQVMLTYQDEAPPLRLAGLRVVFEPVQRRATKFDLAFNLGARFDDAGRPAGIVGRLEYAADLFDRQTVRVLVECLSQVLRSVCADPDRLLNEVQLLDADRSAGTIEVWQRTVTATREATFAEMFEAQVARTPDGVAVEDADQMLSYTQLNAAANRLARYLVAAGVGPEVVVAVALRRSCLVAVALLAIQKAGGVYLPIDVDYPTARIEFMLADAAAAHLVTSADIAAAMGCQVRHTVMIDAPGLSETLRSLDEGNLTDAERRAALRVQHAAYLIYTSGSTGRPKGVLTTHAGIPSLTRTQTQVLGITSGARVLQFASLAFDTSIKEFCTCLLTGATLVSISDEQRLDPFNLGELLHTLRITHASLPPAMLALVPAHSLPPTLTLSVGGDVCPPSLVQRWAPNRLMVNSYGPTESTVVASIWPCDPDRPTVAIGRPVLNTTTHVLDATLNPVPPGVVGELYLAGPGLARAYLNHPWLTAHRFVANPWASTPGERMYRTGDLARWGHDSHLEFLGRLDSQVKLAGHRIELHEIDTVLREHPAVEQAITLIREDQPNQRTITAYIVPTHDAGSTDSASAVGQHIEVWRSVHDETYAESDGPVSADDFTGWVDSYQGDPIPADEMRTWRDSTVERLLALAPERILEIGCGSGILVDRLAYTCQEYCGTDISGQAIERLGSSDLARDLGDRLRLFCQPAHVVDGLPKHHFDLIILNSVIQYFPDFGYLEDVLHKVSTLLKPGGRLFVGDVRNFDLFRAFRIGVELHRATADDTLARVRARVERSLNMEKELLVSPGYFVSLEGGLRNFCVADVLLKRGWQSNELTRYRYDVILHTDGPETPDDGVLTYRWGEDVTTDQELSNMILSAGGRQLRVTGIPNALVWADVEAELRLTDAKSLDEVLAVWRQQDPSGIHPERMHEVAARNGYQAFVSWDCSDPSSGRLDVTFVPVGACRTAGVPRRSAGAGTRHRTTMANSPISLWMSTATVSDVRAFVAARLPAYMVPSAIVLMSSLPIGRNGKLQTALLPAPEASGQRPDRPASPEEELLCAIFAETLGVDEMGVDDNFFERGGHSLLAVRAARLVGERFRRKISVRNLFVHPTAAQLARYLAGSS